MTMTMAAQVAAGMAFGWIMAEVGMAAARRGGEAGQDRGSFWRVGVFVGLGALGAWLAAAFVGGARLPASVGWLGVGLMAFGIGLRYYAMGVLGREFSLRVRVRPDQRVVETGPYRWLRHPAYSGGWLALVGAALTLHNWAAVLVMAGLALVGFGQRIRVEEAVLTDIFGDRYRAYQQHTWRMFPFLY